MIERRSKTYRLKRRVPKRFARVEPRAFIKQSLHTDSEVVAERKAGEVWSRLVEGWEALLSGDTANAQRH